MGINCNKYTNIERKNRIGGGIGLFHKDNVKVKLNDIGERSSFEFALFAVKINAFMIDIAAIYRAPYSTQHPVTLATFFNEFADFASNTYLASNRCIFLGDFNIHMNNDSDPNTVAFNDILNSLSLDQLVSGPTHVSGNTLDLILVREECDFAIKNVAKEFFLSDHRFISADLSTSHPVVVRKQVQFRKVKAIDNEEFRSDLGHEMEHVLNLDNLDDLVTNYNNRLKRVLDDHAPIVSKTISSRRVVPWFDNIASHLKTKTYGLLPKYMDFSYTNYPSSYRPL